MAEVVVLNNQNPLDVPPPSFAAQRGMAFIVGLVGIVLCLIGWITPAPTRDAFYRAWLYAWFFFTGLSLGCMAWVMIHHLVGGGWGRAIQRMAEAGAMNLLLMAILFIPIIIGAKSQYPWANPDLVSKDFVLQHRAGFMSLGPWTIRYVIYFLAWIGLTFWMVRLQRSYDLAPNYRKVVVLRRISAAGLVIYVYGITFAGTDWIMSREPHWFSNVFGFILSVGQALTAINFLVICLTLLLQREPLKSYVTRGHYNDLGNLMFTTIILWAYMNLAQFLISWMGNVQDDVKYYRTRWTMAYAITAIVLHFFLPFFLLLSKDLKRRPERLMKVAIFIFLVHLADIWFMVWPSNEPVVASFNRFWLNIAAPVGIGGLWIAVFLSQLSRRPLLAMPTSGEPSEAMVDTQDPEVGPHGERHAYPA
jgi:hypothetical protein